VSWDFAPDKPIYLQLQEQVKLRIISGKYLPGDKLASVRELSVEASVNPNTMQRALAELERDGLVHTERTSGRFVTRDTEVINKMKNDIAMELVNTFLSKMNEIGYSKSEATDIILNSKEVEHEHVNS